ncbi:hypothetical protein IJM86_04070 [bacterium]|nr:hypothetical protein [bacterium]
MSGKENYEFNEKNQTEQQKVFQEIRQNTKHLENEINKELTETEFNNLQMRQEKEQLTDKEYEKMLQYMDKHTTNMILYIRRISPNLKKKIEDFTQEHQFPNLTLKIDLKNFKNKEQLPKVKYLSFLCDCNYPELTEQSFKEIHEQVNYVLKNHSSFVSCLLTTDNITLEQANKCYQLAYIEGISVKNSVSADTARVLCKFKNTHFNSPELQHEEDYFIKNTMQSYLLTKKQNNPKLDRDSVRF